MELGTLLLLGLGAYLIFGKKSVTPVSTNQQTAMINPVYTPPVSQPVSPVLNIPGVESYYIDQTPNVPEPEPLPIDYAPSVPVGGTGVNAPTQSGQVFQQLVEEVQATGNPNITIPQPVATAMLINPRTGNVYSMDDPEMYQINSAGVKIYNTDPSRVNLWAGDRIPENTWAIVSPYDPYFRIYIDPRYTYLNPTNWAAQLTNLGLVI